MTTFDWKSLPSGRARFSGSIRGWDEAGHDTFAVDVGGNEIFGELKPTFDAGGDDFGVAVVSFGYLDRLDVAIPFAPGANSIEAIEVHVLDAVKRTIIELVVSGVAEGTPSFLKQYPNSRFIGNVIFQPGWCSARMSTGARG